MTSVHCFVGLPCRGHKGGRGTPHLRYGGGCSSLSWLQICSQPACSSWEHTKCPSLAGRQWHCGGDPGQGPRIEEVSGGAGLSWHAASSTRLSQSSLAPTASLRLSLSRNQPCPRSTLAPRTQGSQVSPVHLLSHSWSGGKGWVISGLEYKLQGETDRSEFSHCFPLVV